MLKKISARTTNFNSYAPDPMCFVQIKIGGGGVKCASYCIRNRFRNRYSEIDTVVTGSKK